MIRPIQGLSVALAALLAFGAPAFADNHGDASGSSSGTSAGQASQMDRSSDTTTQDDSQSEMQRSGERDDGDGGQEGRQASDGAMDGDTGQGDTGQGSGMTADGGDGFDQETLQAFVDAAQQIRVVAAGYQPQIAEADTVEERAALQRAAQNEMRAIVRETEGIDAETYARIVSAAREDRALFERIAEMIAKG